MATYSFETIAPTQALQFTVNDRLVFQSGTALQASVSYLTNGDVSIAVGAHTVEFGFSISEVNFPLSFNSDGSSLFIGGPEANSISFGGTGAADAVFGGGGADALDLGTRGGLAQGNQGSDTLLSEAQSTMYGGQDGDTITASGSAHDDFLQGNKGDDVIQGAMHDTLLGGQGNDMLSASGGNNVLNGNLGNDTVTGAGQLFGEDGDDKLTSTGAGADTLDGGVGNDVLNGAAKTSGDMLTAGDGNDFVFTFDGKNTIDGGAGNDWIESESKLSETIQGGSGDDSIFAEQGGAKFVLGGDGDDDIQVFGSGPSNADGGEGNDTIGGGRGPTTVTGGDGDDNLSGGGEGLHLDGGLGNDTFQAIGQTLMTGGGGRDTFILENDLQSLVLGEFPQISDWTAIDKISVPGLSVLQLSYNEATAASFTAAWALAGPPVSNQVFAVQVGADVYVFADNGVKGFDHLGAIALLGRSLSDIDSTSFTG